MREKPESMIDKFHRLDAMVVDVIYKKEGGLNAHMDWLYEHHKDDYEFMFYLCDLYPGWLSKWLDGRMSLAAILENTIEKVETELDSYIVRVTKIQEEIAQHNKERNQC